MATRSTRVGIAVGLAAALLFGAATPLSKELVGDVSPPMLAGLLYLGAFLAVGVSVLARGETAEARLQRQDAAPLLGLIVAGGVLAPVLLLVGLERIQGTTVSLLLNLEGVATLLLGVMIFREHLSKRAAAGAAVVFGGAAALAVGTGQTQVDLVGIGCVTLACVFWGVDNNLTQGLTLRDPFRLVSVKAGAAAAVNLGIALALGSSVPPADLLVGALALGAVAYGVSVVLDAYALRWLGAARESIVFATAPFLGAALSVMLLNERLRAWELAAGAAMGFGVALVATEQHSHWHVHEPLQHEHAHTHDAHHVHDHPEPVAARTVHSHAHQHAPTEHRHEHVSDAHHRHDHST
jgi:drug/metabolite transporter (DMT)-like permease